MSNFNDDQTNYIDKTFTDIELPQKEISAKRFDNCHFIGCDFTETIFDQCKFYECKFTNCNLSMINVKGSGFFDVIFEECKIVGVNWTRAAWPNIKLSSPINFYKCILNDSSFFNLSLREIAMVECMAKDVDLRETDCTEADFAHTDFENSLFVKTNLTKANFSDAINYHINIFENEIKKAKFSLPEAANLLKSLDIKLL